MGNTVDAVAVVGIVVAVDAVDRDVGVADTDNEDGEAPDHPDGKASGSHVGVGVGMGVGANHGVILLEAIT